MVKYLLFVFLILATLTSFAQSKKKKGKKEADKTEQPSSLAPYYPQKDYEPSQKKQKGKVTYDARDKYYDRLEELAKQEKKNARMSEKPQYSDPMYFGHKHPPKKRPANKMKFCKVCGIRH